MNTWEILSLDKYVSEAIKRDPATLLMIEDEINTLFSDNFERINLVKSNDSDMVVCYKVSVTTNSDRLKITAELPGVKAKNITIKASERYIAVTAETKSDKEEFNDGVYTGFRRLIVLPDDVNGEKAHAIIDSGKLIILAPKIQIKQTDYFQEFGAAI